MNIDTYIQHCNNILKGLESLQAIQDEQIPTLQVHGLLTFDNTRRAFDIITIRELKHTFTREFKDCMKARDEGHREII